MPRQKRKSSSQYGRKLKDQRAWGLTRDYSAIITGPAQRLWPSDSNRGSIDLKTSQKVYLLSIMLCNSRKQGISVGAEVVALLSSTIGGHVAYGDVCFIDRLNEYQCAATKPSKKVIVLLNTAEGSYGESRQTETSSRCFQKQECFAFSTFQAHLAKSYCWKMDFQNQQR